MIERVWVPDKGFFLVTDNLEEIYTSNGISDKVLKKDFENEFFKLKINENYDFFNFFSKPAKFLGYVPDHNSVTLYFLFSEVKDLFSTKYWIFEMVVLFYQAKTKYGTSDFQVLLFNTKNGGIDVFYVKDKGWIIGGHFIKGAI